MDKFVQTGNIRQNVQNLANVIVFAINKPLDMNILQLFLNEMLRRTLKKEMCEFSYDDLILIQMKHLYYEYCDKLSLTPHAFTLTASNTSVVTALFM